MIRLLLLFSAGLLATCGRPQVENAKYLRLQGTTMGTQYRVVYHGPYVEQKEIDVLLAEINRSVSTYDSTSLVRAVNGAMAGPLAIDTFSTSLQTIFWQNLELASKVHAASDGAFDPTIMPLVNYWGFGYAEKLGELPDVPPMLMKNIGMDKLQFDFTDRSLSKLSSGVELDFSASAKGYGVDQLALLLEQEGVRNYLVDIGGEMRCLGEGPSGGAWRVGINRPAEDASLNDYEVILALHDQALATSGNYRNYRTLEDGRKVSHSINPKSGYPERTDLLSTTIVANQAAVADAWATACMILGTEDALRTIEALDGIEGMFITSDEQGNFRYEMTSGFAAYIQHQPDSQIEN